MVLRGEMRLRVWDVAHGQCAMLHHQIGNYAGKLAMIDSGCTDDWRPSAFIKYRLNRTTLDYLFITNADQDHMQDLQGLWDEGIHVPVWFRNPDPTAEQWRRMKLDGGPLTDDAKRFISNCDDFHGFPDEPFNQSMGGILCTTFFNTYYHFQDTNNLSLAVFIKYSNFKALFPGDLEKPGWRALLQRPEFCQELKGTNILVASHHGRENGYCEEIFNYFTPDAVVISDKPVEHATQEMVPDYRVVIRRQGVRVRTTGKDRHVLTTRRDGWIQFTVDNDNYWIDTECAG
jgi:beta-lactamase superfamily II metal-dependent hydrolase